MAQNPPLDRLSLFGRERKQCDQEDGVNPSDQTAHQVKKWYT